MSGAWWGKEATPAQRLQDVSPNATPQTELLLCDSSREEVLKELLANAPPFTPEWTNRSAGDAGTALLKLFAEELEPALERINLLPQNSFIQFLNNTGISTRPATPAEALLQFTLADGATQPVPIPQGFQTSAPAADGGPPVIFETTQSLSAVPGSIKELYTLEHGLYESLDPTTDTVPFFPFGGKPKPGVALLIGISANDAADLGSQISLGFDVQGEAGVPAPVSTGGSVPTPAPLSPLLQWSILNGASFESAKVLFDETDGLTSSGIVALEVSDQWIPGIPSGSSDTQPLFWIRAQIVYGAYLKAPVLLSIRLNVARAIAARTIHDEVLTPVANTKGSVMQLSQTPILSGSVVLSVDDSSDLTFAGASPLALPGAASTVTTAGQDWQQVDDLAQFGPDDKVYVLDLASGLVQFGDGVHGKALPQGYRNVAAKSYQVGGGSGGSVAAGKITSLVNSVPFLNAVTNPKPATGGLDAETQQEALIRGPAELRAFGRAVAPADYAALALRTPGAKVARAFAVAGFHPAFSGKPIPGVVCVFVVPQTSGTSIPIADSDTLRAVSSYLSRQIAPAGAEIVAAAPVFHKVRVITTVAVLAGANPSAVAASVTARINSYLDPINGGDDGSGWPFGGTISFSSLVRQIVAGVPEVTAVPNLQFVVDGIRRGNCTDFPISAYSLLWPGTHEVFAILPEAKP
ncbi:MAG TPA: putative baseplate assembly protein [Candidatus Acidoferrum sp.]|nr:putative baseplate assembly protein [Candidatus Acidoferrum sp.]